MNVCGFGNLQLEIDFAELIHVEFHFLNTLLTSRRVALQYVCITVARIALVLRTTNVITNIKKNNARTKAWDLHRKFCKHMTYVRPQTCGSCGLFNFMYSLPFTIHYHYHFGAVDDVAVAIYFVYHQHHQYNRFCLASKIAYTRDMCA